MACVLCGKALQNCVSAGTRRLEKRRPWGGISGILDTRRAEQGQPQEPQHSDPSGEAGSTGPACAFRINKSALGRPSRKGWAGCSRRGAPKGNPSRLILPLDAEGQGNIVSRKASQPNPHRAPTVAPGLCDQPPSKAATNRHRSATPGVQMPVRIRRYRRPVLGVSILSQASSPVLPELHTLWLLSVYSLSFSTLCFAIRLDVLTTIGATGDN